MGFQLDAQVKHLIVVQIGPRRDDHPRLGTASIKPSCSRRWNAARIGVRLIPSSSDSETSFSRYLGP
jgi:hypothetical protein